MRCRTLAIGAIVVFSIAGARAPILAQGVRIGAGAAQGTRFGAVAVHGNAIAQPTILTADSLPLCLWGFSYWIYSKLQLEAPFPLTKHVTLSFVTDQEWAELKARGDDVSVSDAAAVAQFHTRVHLPPAGQRPHVEFQKPREGYFIGRMQLERVVEPYFAALHIPTWIDADGTPQLPRLTQTEADSMRNVIRGYARIIPTACGRIFERG